MTKEELVNQIVELQKALDELEKSKTYEARIGVKTINGKTCPQFQLFQVENGVPVEGKDPYFQLGRQESRALKQVLPAWEAFVSKYCAE